MANPFEVRVPNVLEALMAYDSSYDRTKKNYREEADRAAVAAAAPAIASGNYQNALAQLFSGGGNVNAGLAVAGLGQNARDFDFRRQDSDRRFAESQRLHSPEYIGQVARTQATVQNEFAPKTSNIKLPSGEEVTVERGPQGFRVPQVQGMPTEAGNPFAQPGKPTEGQSNAGLYARRMLQSEPILRETEKVAADPAQRAYSKVPLVGNYLVSGDYQKFDQAQRDFINATLRRESGAVISPEEFNNANKQYFPQPGDNEATVAQKRRNRQEAISGIAAAAGPSFRPSATFGAQGNLIPRQQAAPAQSGPVRISSPQQRDALPSGTQYIAPDGSLRTKQ